MDAIYSAVYSRRVRQVLGDYEFDPWDRDPTEAEARSLEDDRL